MQQAQHLGASFLGRSRRREKERGKGVKGRIPGMALEKARGASRNRAGFEQSTI